MIDPFCTSFKAVPERIVLDVDDIDDTIHGDQQLALFYARYDDYCFQPIHFFEAATGKPVLSLLRPSKAAFRERGGPYPQACHRPHPAQLAPGGNYPARRRPLRHAGGHGTSGRSGLRLNLRPSRKLRMNSFASSSARSRCRSGATPTCRRRRP